MKKITKRIVGLALTAGLALTVGAGVTAVYTSNEDTVITASAATNVDVVESIKMFDCGNMGDYSDTPLYRILLTENDAAPYDFTNFCANEYGGEVLKWIKINGKSIYDHRAEYQAAVKAGVRNPVSSKQGNIAGNPSADNIYAPIFVWFTSHAPALNSKAIDIFIPNDYLPRDQVKSIEITKDFTTDHINEKTGTTATTSYTLSQNVYWAIGGGIRATKHVGGKPAYTTTATTIAAPFLNVAEATNFFSTQLAVSDYANAGANNICIPTATVDSLNFWSYVELNGVSLNKMISDLNSKAIPGEIGFNVWGAQSALSFRFPSFTAEYFNSLTEIKYLKGCQFPSFANPTSAVYELAEDVTFLKQDGVWVNKASIKTAADVTFTGGYIAGDNKEIVKFEIAINDFAWTEEDRDGFDWNYGAGQALRERIKINGKSLYEIAQTVDDSNYVYTGTMATAGKNSDGLDLFQNPAIVQGNIKHTNNKMHVWVHKDYLATLGDEVTITISAGAQNWMKNATLAEDASQIYYRYADGSYATTKAEEVTAELTEISTMVHSHNFITFYLNNLDLPEGTEGLKIIGKEKDTQYSKVNFLNYIYVNGKPLSESNIGELIYNLSGPNSISVRLIDFGQEGDDGFDNKVFTAAIKKIEVKAGAQFPAYSYAFENGAVKAYTTAEDTLWIYDGSKWISECNVTFTNEAGETVSTQVVAPLATATEIEAPAKEVEEGFEAIFLGWYNGETAWDFSTPVTGDITLTPKYEVKKAPPKPEVKTVLLDITSMKMPSQTAYATTAKYVTVDETEFGYLQIGSYGDGLQWRTKNGVSATLWNKTAFDGKITKIVFTHRSNKTAYDGNKYTLALGNTADCSEKTMNVGTSKSGVMTIEIDGDYTFFKITHANTYTQYWDNIQIFYEKAIQPVEVNFANEAGDVLSTQELYPTEVLTEPAAPTKEVAEGYEATFLGWYNGDEKWNFENPVAEAMTLVAKFEVKAIEYTLAFVHPRTGMPLAAPMTYTVENMGEIVFPEVPADLQMEGYTVAWDKTAADLVIGGTNVSPVWTAIEYTLAFVHPRTGMPLAAPMTYTVENMGEIVFPEVPADLAMEGYTVAWDKTAADLVIGGTNVSPVWTAIEYTLAFVHPRTGMPLAAPITYTVENMGEIVFPEVPSDLQMEGYTVAWDKTAADLVIGGMNVSPVWTAIEYTVTFVADGATVGTATYTVENTEITVPEVPAKEGYTGAWEAYELTTGDITVNAVYTEVEEPTSSEPATSEPDDSSDEPTSSEPATSEPTTSEPTTSEPEAEKKGGCGSVIGGVSAALTLVAAAAIVMKKKED